MGKKCAMGKAQWGRRCFATKGGGNLFKLNLFPLKIVFNLDHYFWNSIDENTHFKTA